MVYCDIGIFIMHKIVFLDLEATVIDDFTLGWAAAGVNMPLVKEFLKEQAADEVKLFSFALTNDWDVAHYRQMFQKWIDAALDVKINLEETFTTDKLYRLCRRNYLVFENEQACMRFHGKQLGFQRFVELTPEFDDMELVLLDDDVEPMTLHYPKRNLTVRMVNVADLRAP